MAGSSESDSKGGMEVSVVPCKGWMDPCEFCDKRFCAWVTTSSTDEDDNLEKIPNSIPGVIMLALQDKKTTETVFIAVSSQQNLQELAYKEVDSLRARISDKKSKATKSSILLRWMTFTKKNEKDAFVLYAHWINVGVLPKYQTSWPGEKILQDQGSSPDLVFSTKLQQWCYPKRNPVWQKPKQKQKSVLDVVEKCEDWSKPCEFCDVNFTPWKELDEVLEQNLVPKEDLGLCMYGARIGKKREVIFIIDPYTNPDFYSKEVKRPQRMKDQIEKSKSNANYNLKNGKFKNKNAILEIRWMRLNDLDSENACFAYAHWLNAETLPVFQYHFTFAEKALEKNKNFVLRIKDKKWCYETIVGKPDKFSKMKNKRDILKAMDDEGWEDQ